MSGRLSFQTVSGNCSFWPGYLCYSYAPELKGTYPQFPSLYFLSWHFVCSVHENTSIQWGFPTWRCLCFGACLWVLCDFWNFLSLKDMTIWFGLSLQYGQIDQFWVKPGGSTRKVKTIRTAWVRERFQGKFEQLTDSWKTNRGRKCRQACRFLQNMKDMQFNYGIILVIMDLKHEEESFWRGRDNLFEHMNLWKKTAFH